MKHVDIWTDGASRGNPGPGGYGAVLKYTDKNNETHRKELKAAFENTTNNRMEVLSAIVALNELKEPCEVTLSSDSKYLVNALIVGLKMILDVAKVMRLRILICGKS